VVGVLSAALLFVFVVLPEWVQPDAPSTAVKTPSGATTTSAEPSPGSTASAPPANNGSTPFQDAQIAKQRRAAQEVLQALLTQQETLVDRGVEQWAGSAYADAMAKAAAGDEAYKAQAFTGALEQYQQALALLEAIAESIPERAVALEQTLLDAIETGATDLATETLALLSTLAPETPAVIELTRRVEAIPLVSAALETAAKAAEQDDFAAAVQGVATALAADAQHQRARQLQQQYNTQKQDQDFRQAMTQGYAQLDQESFASAQHAFERARSIKPQAQEPALALAELAQARTNAELRDLQTQARAHENAEAWEQAAQAYDRALAIDATLEFARVGLARVQPRATLAKHVQKILEEPNRLSDPVGLGEAQALLADLRALPPSGQQLNQHIEQLQQLLDYATTPVTVGLQSDGLTDITLLRVRRLGTFDSTTLTLRPGEYTAVGMRQGYRDVRVNFTVRPGQTPSVDIRCKEPI
jgi:tetratricopeptide (TPR) repeat protein